MLPALVLACSAAVWFDLRTRRLPNWLTIGSLAVALAMRALAGGPELWPGVASAVMAFAFGFPFFLAGGLGGGDVKLMAGLAAFLEPGDLPNALLVMALFGAAMAIVAAARRGLLAHTFAKVHVLVLRLGRSTFAGWKHGTPGSSTDDTVSNPYALAIVAGALAGWFS